MECRVSSYIHMNCRKHSSVLIYFHYIQIGRRETLFFFVAWPGRLLVLVTNTYAALFQTSLRNLERETKKTYTAQLFKCLEPHILKFHIEFGGRDVRKYTATRAALCLKAQCKKYRIEHASTILLMLRVWVVDGNAFTILVVVLQTDSLLAIQDEIRV